MTKAFRHRAEQATKSTKIDLGAASKQTKGSNNHSVDGIEAQQLPKFGLSND